MNIVAEGTVERLKAQLKKQREHVEKWRLATLALASMALGAVIVSAWLSGVEAKNQAAVLGLLNAEEQHSAELEKRGEAWKREARRWKVVAKEEERILGRCQAANPKWSQERP